MISAAIVMTLRFTSIQKKHARLHSICRYYTWHFGYWESRGIPGPKPIPVFGTMLPLFKKVNNTLQFLK